MNFKNMSIRKSLIVGFGTTIVISVIIIVTALVMMTSQKNAYKDILDRYVASTDMIATCRIDYNIAARNLRDAVLSGDMSNIDSANSKISQLKEEIEKYQADYEENTKRLNEITTNPDAIEQIAREKYLMKKPNEDIYVFED